MKVSYDSYSETYLVKIEESETVIHLSTKDIVETREELILYITRLFNDAVNNKLKD